MSRLSPHIHWGEISPHQIWDAIHHQAPNSNTDHFLSELGWREFSYYLLYHFPSLPTDNFNPKFDAFVWHHRPKQLMLWQKAKQATLSLMPPCASFIKQATCTQSYAHGHAGFILVKNLGIHWHHGERWFGTVLLMLTAS